MPCLPSVAWPYLDTRFVAVSELKAVGNTLRKGASGCPFRVSGYNRDKFEFRAVEKSEITQLEGGDNE